MLGVLSPNIEFKYIKFFNLKNSNWNIQINQILKLSNQELTKTLARETAAKIITHNLDPSEVLFEFVCLVFVVFFIGRLIKWNRIRNNWRRRNGTT